MKDTFRSYYKLDEKEIGTLWENAVFVFDTNVLLNMYRYQQSTRESFFSVIEKLKDRIWIPYHVGLEFQKNRLNVIATQHKTYSEVKKIVSGTISSMKKDLDKLQLKNRHSCINPDELIKDIEKITGAFLTTLCEQEKKSMGIASTDEIRRKIDEFFKGKVGKPPKNQDEIDKLFKEGEVRYKDKIPPGYDDNGKVGTFRYNGIRYEEKYGDLIIWKQIISHMKDVSSKGLIFITEDNKSDWWWKVKDNGEKTIGVRPELADELFSELSTNGFYIYTADKFLEYAEKKFHIQIADGVIEEVRELSAVPRVIPPIFPPAIRFYNDKLARKNAVFTWLKNMFPNIEENHEGYFDFIAYKDHQKYGFEVKVVGDVSVVLGWLKEMLPKVSGMLYNKEYHESMLVFEVMNVDDIYPKLFQIKERMIKGEDNIKIIVGQCTINEVDVHGNFNYIFQTYYLSGEEDNMY